MEINFRVITSPLAREQDLLTNSYQLLLLELCSQRVWSGEGNRLLAGGCWASVYESGTCCGQMGRVLPAPETPTLLPLWKWLREDAVLELLQPFCSRDRKETGLRDGDAEL